MTTLDFPKSSNLRQRIDLNERIILAAVAAHKHGYLIERGKESRAHEILVEDGYLTHTIETGTSRSYSRFKLTEMGRQALRLVAPNARPAQ